MKVQGRDYRTVWMENGVVFYIDQNLLPFDFIIRKAVSHQESCRVIRSMAVRGAGAIGALAGFAMAQAFLEAAIEGGPEYAEAARKEIAGTRPTARNLFHALEIVYRAGLSSAGEAVAAAQQVADCDSADSRRIGEYGNGLIRSGMGIETHCNAGWLAFVDYGTALSPIYTAHREGKDIFVYVDETRPRNQGSRLTAWELGNEGVPHAIIPDNAAAHYMSKGKINLVITGADRIAANGDTANKIGTLEKAILAGTYGIPFYVAAPTSTFDINCLTGDDIVIEERNADEVLFQEGIDEHGHHTRIRVSSPGSAALNPAFDVTPARYITGIITEKGIIKPDRQSISEIINPKP